VVVLRLNQSMAFYYSIYLDRAGNEQTANRSNNLDIARNLARIFAEHKQVEVLLLDDEGHCPLFRYQAASGLETAETDPAATLSATDSGLYSEAERRRS